MSEAQASGRSQPRLAGRERHLDREAAAEATNPGYSWPRPSLRSIEPWRYLGTVLAPPCGPSQRRLCRLRHRPPRRFSTSKLLSQHCKSHHNGVSCDSLALSSPDNACLTPHLFTDPSVNCSADAWTCGSIACSNRPSKGDAVCGLVVWAGSRESSGLLFTSHFAGS